MELIKKLGFLLFLVSLFNLCKGQNASPDLVVGRGSGNIPTIKEAIETAGQKKTGEGRFVIKINAGVYNENVVIGANLPNLTLIGDGKSKTVITGELSVLGSNNNLSTYKTATVGVDAPGFIARGITFRNTAGPDAGQAVALRVSGDKSAFYSCSFEGYQDTLYVHHGRQFYKKCDIYGTVDFIFGDAEAVFQDCNIFLRRPPGNVAVITASKREDPDNKTGIIIQKSQIAPEPGTNLDGIKVYLGRPWGDSARTVFMETNMGDFIDPEGWLWWEGKNETLKNNVYYAEYQNTGPGSSTDGRVNWANVATPKQAKEFSVAKFIDGKSWLPSTNVPFKSSL